MAEADEELTLHRYLRNARGVLLLKLEGMSDYDIRRPMTPTGTNLLRRDTITGAQGTSHQDRRDRSEIRRR
jgi:Protein of unknown function (DUF664)